jgi:aminoglycoside phosphotransferase (APT) family kinase protein
MMDEIESARLLRDISEQFEIPGTFISAVPHGAGYINDTFLARYDTGSGMACFIHQRINHNVFKEPAKVMENIQRVTQYAREQITAAGGDPERETLNLIPTRAGRAYHYIPEDAPMGGYWRTYRFISGAHSFEVAENLEQVFHAARAFGNFQKLLDGLPGPRLHETILNFHHTRKRFETFRKILESDPVGRAGAVQPEIDFVLQREQDASLVVDLLARGALPERVTHNDTKLNNVLIDDITGQGVCVIDLDTVMPGSVLYDFGDLIRMGTATAAEDERNLSKMGLDLRLFTELARGYLSAAGELLTALEWELLVFGGKLITYEQAIRFLGDYLNGDTYYKTQYPEHNLVRARTQIKMIAEMERKKAEMEEIVGRLRRGGGASKVH